MILTVCFGLMLSTGNAQVFEKNNVNIDLYYGGINWFTFLNRLDYSGNPNIQLSGLGPIGVRGEFMLTEMLGIGLDVSINRSRADILFTEFNIATNTVETFTHTSRTQKIGAIATFNFHPLKSERFDLAVVGGIGYGLRTYSEDFPAAFSYVFINNGFVDGKYNFFRSDDSFFGSGTVSVPLAFRIGMVMRVFITENIGLNFGVGAVHGGIFNGGVSFKF